MKNHKEKGSMKPNKNANEGKNGMKQTGFKDQKNVSEENKNGSMRPEKHSESNKKNSESGKSSMNFNNTSNKREETGKSKYFGDYKKTCTTDKCCNCNKTNCNCK
jgi:hypothetical protein